MRRASTCGGPRDFQLSTTGVPTGVIPTVLIRIGCEHFHPPAAELFYLVACCNPNRRLDIWLG